MEQSIDMLHELDAGIFMQKLDVALKEAGVSAVNTGKQSKVTIELKFDQIASSRQVNVTHKILQVIPRKTGKNTDEDIKSTPIHVHTNGILSVFAEEQLGFQFQPTTEK